MELSLIGLVWIVGAFIAVGVAQSKGRSGLAWFGLSLIFGPIAWLVLAATSPIYD